MVNVRFFSSVLALCFAVLTSAGCGGAETAVHRDTTGSAPLRLLVVGVDGLEPSLVERFVDEGTMPHMKKLIERGSMAKIDCVVGTSSPVVWTTVATGVPPAQHNITDFTHEGEPVTSTLRREPAFWNILPQYGLQTATVGWMVTWPAEEDSGIVVSDRSHWGRFPDKVAPGEVLNPSDYWPDDNLEFVSRFTSYPFETDFRALPRDDPRFAVNFLLQRRFVDIYRRDRTYSRIAQDLLAEHPIEVMATYFQGVDYVSHGFWKYFEPEPYRAEGWTIDDAEIAHLKELIPRYYSFTDRLIGNLLQQVDDDTLIIVLSDHGFGTGLGKFRIKGGDFISGNHRPEGVLVMAGPQVESGVPQAGTITHFDILPTMLYALGVPQSRELHGHPLLGYFKASFLDSRPPRFVRSYRAEDMPEAGEVTQSEHDEEILKELRSLGYIE